MTQKELIAKMAADIKSMKISMPHGEAKRMEEKLDEMCQKQDRLYDLIMDPETGLIVSTNKNTEFRITCEPKSAAYAENLRVLLKWKTFVDWGFGIVFVAIIGAIVNFFRG